MHLCIFLKENNIAEYFLCHSDLQICYDNFATMKTFCVITISLGHVTIVY